jgi:hypothetical protein
MSEPQQIDTHWIYYDTLFRHGYLGTFYRMLWPGVENTKKLNYSY